MEVLVSAIMGELAARCVSFLMDRCVNWAADEDIDDGEKRSCRLQRLLLRVHVIVEEAEQRRITSQAMLRHLNLLREEMFRGYHALDDHESSSSRRRVVAGEASRLRLRRHSVMSQFNPSKRVCLLGWRQRISGGSNDIDGDRLQRVLGSLEAAVSDVGELVTFLTGCPPRLNRQPYSTYLFLDTCMFGRQMEMDRVVAFLLQDEGLRPHQQRPDVLTILGPRRAGKSTLVEHACRDERVRSRFSQIVSLTRGDLLLLASGMGSGDEDIQLPLQLPLLPAPTSNGGGGQQGGGSSSINQQEEIMEVLVIVELDGERNSKGQDAMAVTESLLERFCSSTCNCKSRRRTPFVIVTKIIVTSRSEKISSFGTVEPLRLRPPTQEALWYLVKARAFGSTDAAEHPEMVAIAMDMAAEMHGSFAFAAADLFGGLMRSSFSARFWSLALLVLREFKKKNLLSRLHQTDEVEERAEKFVHLDEYQIKPSSSSCSTQQQHGIGEVPIIPMVSLRDILFGGARPQGKFEVVGWKSTVPPYYTYAYRCEILRGS